MKKKDYRGLWLQFDRILARDLLKQLGILAIVLFVIFWISFLLLSLSWNDWEQFCDKEKLKKWTLPLYLLIDTNALNNLYMGNDGTSVNGWMLFSSSIIYVLGVVIFSGMIISVMTNAIGKRIEYHKEGRIHNLKSGHYIIMGYDDMVPSFINHIFEKDKDAYILLLISEKPIEINEFLRNSLKEERYKRVIINYGHRTSAKEYKEIHLESAEQIYIVGSHSHSANDAINVECVDSIYRYLENPEIKQTPNRITCVFKDLDTYAAFKTSDIFGKKNKLDIDFVPYNFYTGWAKQVFIKRFHKDMDNPDIEIKYPPVYGNGIKPDDNKYVHLVFVGTTNFAVAFAMEAANVLHFPNFNHGENPKTKITFIELNADKEKDEFITRNRHLFEVQSHTYKDLSNDNEGNIKPRSNAPTYFNETNGYKKGIDFDFLDIEFEFIKGDIFSENVQREICQWAKDTDNQYLSIFLAMADQRKNFVMGMNMPDEVYDNEIPIFIRQDRSDTFVTNLRETDTKERSKKLTYSNVKDDVLKQKKRDARYAHIYPFGMNESAYSADEVSLKRAKLINYLYDTANYSTNKFQSILALDAMSEDQIWEEANKKWKDLTVALKWSNLYSAYTIRTKMASLRVMRGLDIDDTSHDFNTLSDYEVEEMAKVEHNRWNVEKLLMGFRKAHKDEDKYEHPQYADKLKNNKNLFIHHDIRPYDELGIIKDLDREFSRYIPWILKMTDKNQNL